MSAPTVAAFVGLGANLGDAQATLRRAVRAIHALPGVWPLACSSLYRSAPVDAQGPDFLNAVLAVRAAGSPELLWRSLAQLEQAEGRERPYRNAPRTLDLDLLLHGDARLSTPDLTVPHPRLHERAFVLVPLAQIAPGRVTPAQLDAVRHQRVERLDVTFP